MKPEKQEPEIRIKPVPDVSMTVRSTGYGVGLLWCSHLRVGRRQVTYWYDSPSRSLREISQSTVTRKVQLLGRECFEVGIKERQPGEQEWAEPHNEYFWVADDGTHWIWPKEKASAPSSTSGRERSSASGNPSCSSKNPADLDSKHTINQAARDAATTAGLEKSGEFCVWVA